jgi:hypothetical protein
MGDARLDSLHLPMPRRQDFRRAREVLLHARGENTVLAERHGARDLDGPHDTVMHEPPDAVPAEMDFWLMDRDRCVYPLKIGLNTLGRSPDNDVVVKDAYTSRRHCAILVHLRDGCELHDIASKNGTFLNGTRLTRPTRLRTGDEIRVCDQRFIFLSRQDADPRFLDTLAKR